MKTLLIDADGLVYKIAFTSQHAVNWADQGMPELWTLWADEDEAWYRLRAYIEALKETFEADAAFLCLSDDRNFRYDILATYKGNRNVNVQTMRPLLHGRLRERVQAELPNFLKPNLEADDVMGIIATCGDKIVKGDKLIVSDDKDMLTIAAPQVHFEGKLRDVCTPTEMEADRWHLRQSLTGDTVDHYDGCPGFGPVAADKVLVKFDGNVAKFWQEVVLPAYAKKGLTEEQALVQARCARILRAQDFNFKTGEPKLWEP
ncbi:exonuclease protein [Rhizobium phage RHph_I20]|uniref:Exonuclease protein n=1 Tax=Rhizobium phage RHph_I20 TaxID=2509730 RepID=A0A7S5RFN1_9CAUD|nr:exonuclease protein [Rhizobium phage RHph_I20]